jgi:hypothetical protein
LNHEIWSIAAVAAIARPRQDAIPVTLAGFPRNCYSLGCCGACAAAVRIAAAGRD